MLVRIGSKHLTNNNNKHILSQVNFIIDILYLN